RHDLDALASVTPGQEALLRRRRMGDHDVRVSALRQRQRLAAACGDDLDRVFRMLRREGGQQRVEQPAVFDRRRAGEDDLPLTWLTGRGEQEEADAEVRLPEWIQ